jgi:hypothetical protein
VGPIGLGGEAIINRSSFSGSSPLRHTTAPLSGTFLDVVFFLTSYFGPIKGLNILFFAKN